MNDDEGQSRFFLLDDPGGTGKTYLYDTFIASLRKQNKCTLSYATTDIAADLLIDGRIIHSRLKLIVPLHDSSTSHMRITSESSEKLKQARLSIINEASVPFGGKLLLLGGDFRQTGPIIPRGSNAAVIESSIKQSSLWYFVIKLSLTKNMHIAGQDDFNWWLLDVGNRTVSDSEGLEKNIIEIPQNMVSTNNIVRDVFGKNYY
uniref:ATP-dependent DNA helicase n=1 Tax=Octopus bimaculoides TaxID=37653 RepID=A0A0L8HFJ4_OCTBM